MFLIFQFYFELQVTTALKSTSSIGDYLTSLELFVRHVDRVQPARSNGRGSSSNEQATVVAAKGKVVQVVEQSLEPISATTEVPGVIELNAGTVEQLRIRSGHRSCIMHPAFA